jgi:hypothetical protein
MRASIVPINIWSAGTSVDFVIIQNAILQTDVSIGDIVAFAIGIIRMTYVWGCIKYQFPQGAYLFVRSLSNAPSVIK